jgi:hypothetical protein
LLGKTHEDRRSKMKVETKVMETTHNVTTKCCFSCGEEGHLSRSCSRKRERFHTIVVEYEEQELRDLLALERPKRRKEISKVQCFNCKELGHCASKCPKRNNKASRLGSMKKDPSLVTCCKCNWKGHYAKECSERYTLRLPWTWITERCHKYKEMP